MFIILYFILIIFVVLYFKFWFKEAKLIFQLTQHKQYKFSQLKSIWQIPGPFVLPFLGTKWIFFRKYKISKIHEAYEDLNKTYGPIILEITTSGVPVVHLFSKKDIDKVLKYPSRYPFRPPTEIVSWYRKSRSDRYASLGITNEQGEKWHFLRSRLTPHITSPKTVQAFLPVLNLVCDDFIELLKSKRNQSDNCVENFHYYVNLLGLEAVCTLMLGRRMGFFSLSHDSKQSDPTTSLQSIEKLANAVKQLFISQRDSYYGFGFWKYVPTKLYSNFVKSEEYIYNTISNLVDKALEEEDIHFSDDVRSVFYNILQIEDMDIRDKKSAIIDFIAAGIETLANSLIFTLYYVTSHPRITDKIFNEFVTSGGNIDKNCLNQAVYTKACLQEAFRMHPTAFCLARILEEDMVLSGYDIKAGTVVLCQNMIACLKEENFKNARTFIPERWLEKEYNTNLSTCIVSPFGIGRRTCPGKRFVEMELLLLVAKMTLAFDIKFADKLITDFEFILTPKTPVNIILKDR